MNHKSVETTNKFYQEVVTVINNQKADDVVNKKLAQFVEDVANLYGVKIHVEDTDWQLIYDLKSNLHEALEGLGVEIIHEYEAVDRAVYKRIFKEQGLSIEVAKRGYFPVFDGEFNIEIIQRIDCLEQYGMSKFETDTEAGKQALKDGYKLFTVEHEDLVGWYILDTPENRKVLSDKGYL